MFINTKKNKFIRWVLIIILNQKYNTFLDENIYTRCPKN